MNDAAARLAAAGTDQVKLDAVKRDFPAHANRITAAGVDAVKLSAVHAELAKDAGGKPSKPAGIPV